METLDGTGYIVMGNHSHATRQHGCVFPAAGGNRVNTQVPVSVRITVAKRNGAGFPASAIIAAPERPERVQKLMVRIGLPLRRFASTGDDDAGAIQRAALAGRNSGGEVHETVTGHTTPEL